MQPARQKPSRVITTFILVVAAIASAFLLLFSVLLFVFLQDIALLSELIVGRGFEKLPALALVAFAVLMVKNAVIFLNNRDKFWAKGPGSTVAVSLNLLCLGLLAFAVLGLLPLEQAALEAAQKSLIVVLASAYFFITALLLWLPAEQAKAMVYNMLEKPLCPWRWIKKDGYYEEVE